MANRRYGHPLECHLDFGSVCLIFAWYKVANGYGFWLCYTASRFHLRLQNCPFESASCAMNDCGRLFDSTRIKDTK